jgi:hypothetical protein
MWMITTTKYSMCAPDQTTTFNGTTPYPCDYNGLYVWGYFTMPTLMTSSLEAEMCQLQVDSWPDMLPANLTWAYAGGDCSGFANVTPGALQIEYSAPDFSTQNSYLLTNVTQGAVTGQFRFSNFSVRVDLANIKPTIQSIDVKGTKLTVTMYSTTVGGTAYVSTNPPDLVVAQSIQLLPTPTEYTLTIEKPEYDGSATLYLVAGMNKASRNFSINIDQRLNYTADAKVIIEDLDPTNLGLHFDNIFNGQLPSVTRWLAAMYAIIECIGIVLVVVIIYVIIRKSHIITRIRGYRPIPILKSKMK